MFFGEVRASGDLEADGFVEVLGEEDHQVRGKVRIARERATTGWIVVVGQMFGKGALQATGGDRSVVQFLGVEDRARQWMILVMLEQSFGADLAVGVVEKRDPSRLFEMRPGPRG
ncbi:hypothetical protein ACWGLP_18825 [Streptomyces lydicus]